MKNLLRAFPETPEYVASAIRAGMAKARRREVWRRRAYAAASVAAVFAVLIGGLTLALNRGRFAGSGAPRDIRGPLSPGLALSARPDPAATPMPTPMPTELPTVYPTPMVSAPPSATLEPLESAEWERAAGNVEEAHAQSALAPTEVAQLYYYSTRGGQFYHADPGCTGMVGASLRPIDECQALGQAACPVCLEIDEDDPYFFSTLGGTHYHVEAHCSGMIGALARPKSEVEKLGQSPCPVCIGVGSMWVRGAWWDGAYLLIAYDVEMDEEPYVAFPAEEIDTGHMMPVDDVGEVEDLLGGVEPDEARYIERGRAELLRWDRAEPVAVRAFRDGNVESIYAMYAADSREDMYFAAEMYVHAYYLGPAGELYALETGYTECVIVEDGAHGGYRLHSSDGVKHLSLEHLIDKWQVERESTLGSADGSARLRTLGGTFEGMVLLEQEFADGAIDVSRLTVGAQQVPMTLEPDAEGTAVMARSILTAEEAEQLNSA